MTDKNGNKTISQVVELLSKDYDGVSISKLRYLEDEGLLAPKRTKGGYRTYSGNDIERIKAILRLQTEQYLPLHVIREKLNSNDSSNIVENKSTEQLEAEALDDQEVYSKEELSKVAGISEDSIDQLITYGLIKGNKKDDGAVYFNEDLVVARLAKEFERFNIEPRHLRMFEAHADKKSSLFLQILLPIVRQRSIDNKKKTMEIHNELQVLSSNIEKFLLDRAMRDFVSSLQ